MARRGRRGRPVNGILLLDKPIGLSSNEALQAVKRLYQARKAGHTGSLDRLASGLLPVCFGEATKLSGFLLNADKRYRSTFKLGVRTSTGDAEGEVVERRAVPALTREAVEGVLEGFRGVIDQVPPMHSAIKHQGQRLYKLAHQGLVVERQARQVTIHRLELIELGADSLRVDVSCSKGTYIRTLAEEIGEAIGCGASVAELRRTGSGPFDDARMYDMAQIEALAAQGFDALDAALLPTDSALSDWPEVRLLDTVAYYLLKGQPVLVPRAPTAGYVRIYDQRASFLGVGEVLDDGRIAPRRLLDAKP